MAKRELVASCASGLYPMYRRDTFSHFAVPLFLVPSANFPMQAVYKLQELRCQIAACSSQLRFCCWPTAGSISWSQAPVVVRSRLYFSTNAHALISSIRGCHTSNGICNSTDGKIWGHNGNRKKCSTSPISQKRNSHADGCHLLSWPSVFHPLLEGLPRAVPHSERQKEQMRQRQADSSSPLRNCTTNRGADCETRCATTDYPATSAAAPPAEEKKLRAATFYIIHTFHLHPYEAIVFEEALYRFLGERTKRVYERSWDAGIPQPRRTNILSTKLSEAVQRIGIPDAVPLALQREDLYIPAPGHATAEGGSSVLATQLHEPLSQTQCQQRDPLVQQVTKRESGGHLPSRQLQQYQGRNGQLRSKRTSATPSVACAFFHHPPYRPVRAQISCEDNSSSSTKEGSRAKQVSLSGQTEYHFPCPSRVVIFGLSGNPAACVRDPETVLQQKKALFIKRFTGGGTVVLGSGCECFCVGLLLPHTFSHCRPYPRDLLNLCTSLYLGDNIWEKQRCISSQTSSQQAPIAASCFAANDAAAIPKSTVVVPTGGSCSIRETPAAESFLGTPVVAVRGIKPEAAGVQSRQARVKQLEWEPSSLYDLSPFTALRWGLLENDYVITCPSSSLSYANPSDTSMPGTSEFLLHDGPGHSVECCSKLVMGTPLKTIRPAVTTHNPFSSRLTNSLQTIFKVGGNAQALSRQYALQHTSFVWDEEELQRELKDLLLLPKKQPKYRGSRSHVAFLRSVREGLKSHVRVSPLRNMNEEYVRSHETADNRFCRGGGHLLHSYRPAPEPPSVRETGPVAAEEHGGNRFAPNQHANSSAQDLFAASDKVSGATVSRCATGGAGPARTVPHVETVASCSRHASEMTQQETGGADRRSPRSNDRFFKSAPTGSHAQLDCAAETQALLPLDSPSSVLLSLGLLLEGHVSIRNAALHMCSCLREAATSRRAPDASKCSCENAGNQTNGGSLENVPVNSKIDRVDRCVADASLEGREEGTEERAQHEEVWDCVHCVVAAYNKIPVEFKRLWDATGSLADPKSEESPGSEACRTRTAIVSRSDADAGPFEGNAEPEKTKENGTGRCLHVLPIEAVRAIVYELFKGSLKDMRSTRLVGAGGEEIPESVYGNIFEVNRIIPV